jgi:hypothetical protein
VSPAPVTAQVMNTSRFMESGIAFSQRVAADHCISRIAEK